MFLKEAIFQEGKNLAAFENVLRQVVAGENEKNPS
jgi:hypothetical protein